MDSALFFFAVESILHVTKSYAGHELVMIKINKVLLFNKYIYWLLLQKR
jgi:hypothetical protein